MPNMAKFKWSQLDSSIGVWTMRPILVKLAFCCFGMVAVLYLLSSTTRIETATSTLLCEQVAHNTHMKHRYQNQPFRNPAKEVVDELLEIVDGPENVCNSGQNAEADNSEKYLVAIVDSARDNFKARQVIRMTWGSIRYYKGWHIRTVFLLGQHSYCFNNGLWGGKSRGKIREEESIIKQEQSTHGDLVIGAFTDTYKNLTYKHLMGYNFVLTQCPQAEFIVKTDDDIFVNIPAILDFRMTEEGQQQDMLCRTMDHDPYPTRCKNCANGRWYSTREEWPEDLYPKYCLGAHFAMSREWAELTYNVRHYGFFWIDDVFISGKLRETVEAKYERKCKKFTIDERTNWNTSDAWFNTFLSGDVELVEKQKEMPWYKTLPRNDLFEERMVKLWKIPTS